MIMFVSLLAMQQLAIIKPLNKLIDWFTQINTKMDNLDDPGNGAYIDHVDLIYRFLLTG